ncbi:MAG: hypothetical protein JWO73_883 [Candidatus Taylorbacteria bacterium]|nr:hypothetical protein [Candidatus Taylorbacteria bacterium]
MFNIGGFFQKFKSLELEDFRKRSIVIDAIKKRTNIDLRPQDIKFEQGRVRLSISSLEKNEIFMKKAALVADIQALLDKPKISDIV